MQARVHLKDFTGHKHVNRFTHQPIKWAREQDF